jgi:hypothetical protein
MLLRHYKQASNEALGNADPIKSETHESAGAFDLGLLSTWK